MTPRLGWSPSSWRQRAGWRGAFFFAAGPPAISIGSWGAIALFGDTVDVGSSGGIALLYLWIGVVVASSVVCGLAAGFIRAVVATAVVWTLVAATSLIVFGETCPLSLDAVPTAPTYTASTVPLAAVDRCVGTGEPSFETTADWSLLAAMIFGVLAAVGGIIGDTSRWVARRRAAARS